MALLMEPPASTTPAAGVVVIERLLVDDHDFSLWEPAGRVTYNPRKRPAIVLTQWLERPGEEPEPGLYRATAPNGTAKAHWPPSVEHLAA